MKWVSLEVKWRIWSFSQWAWICPGMTNTTMPPCLLSLGLPTFCLTSFYLVICVPVFCFKLVFELCLPVFSSYLSAFLFIHPQVSSSSFSVGKETTPGDRLEIERSKFLFKILVSVANTSTCLFVFISLSSVFPSFVCLLPLWLLTSWLTYAVCPPISCPLRLVSVSVSFVFCLPDFWLSAVCLPMSYPFLLRLRTFYLLIFLPFCVSITRPPPLPPWRTKSLRKTESMIRYEQFLFKISVSVPNMHLPIFCCSLCTKWESRASATSLREN